VAQEDVVHQNLQVEIRPTSTAASAPAGMVKIPE
jgi:hypothetical protein